MIPYPNPTSRFDVHGPDTQTTGQIVQHGGRNLGQRQLTVKGNPVGWMQHGNGRYYPYFSSRMEHSHQPIEHAMLNSVDVDHYGLGQIMPREVQQVPPRSIRPSAQGIFAWPDTSVSSAFQPHITFGGLDHPDGEVYAGTPYPGNRTPNQERRATRGR